MRTILDFEISGDSSKYERAMRNVEKSTIGITDLVSKSFLVIGAAMGVAYKAMDEFRESLNMADQLNKLSKSTGIAVEELSAYKYAADLSGVSIEQTAKGLNILARNMAEAGSGSKEMTAIFNAMSIQVKNDAGNLLPTDQVLGQIADRFAGMPDGATKAAFAMKLFGDAGSELIPLLNQGSTGLAQMREEAERAGQIISTDAAQAAEGFNDNIEKLKKNLQGMANVLMEKVVPSLAIFTSRLNEALGITPKDMERSLLEQRKAIENQLRFYEEKTAKGENFLNRLFGFNDARAAQKVQELKGQIAAINQDISEVVLGKLPSLAGGMVDGIRAGNIRMPQKEVAPVRDVEGERLQKQIEDETAKTMESLNARNQMELYMEGSLDAALYTMREGRFSVEVEMRERELELETGFVTKKMELNQWEHDAALQLAQIEADETAKIEEQKAKIRQQATADMINNAAYAFRELGKNNKAAFAAFKAVSIAQTLIKTYESATAAYAAMAGIPVVGPALGIAAAAAAIGAGLVNVSAIASTEPGGGARGAVGTYAASPTTGLPTAFPAPGGEGQQVEQRSSLTINIQGDMIGDEGYVELLAEKISKAVESRDVRLVASNSHFAEALS